MANRPRPTSLNFLVLPGDGIGPEVVAQGVRLLEFLADRHSLDIRVSHDLIGGQCWDEHGTFCLDETVSTAKASDGVLVGAVGGPQWDNQEISGTPAEKDGLMRLRQELDAYAGLRPSRAYSGLLQRTPFRPDVVQGSAMSEVPSPSASGHPCRSVAEVPAAYGQSSTESSTPSPSVSRAAERGSKALSKSNIRRGEILRFRSPLPLCMAHRA